MSLRISLSLKPEEYVPPAPRIASRVSASRFQFRVQPAANLERPHWLLSHPFGRDVLVNKVGEVRPELRVLRYRQSAAVDAVLDAMVDLMELRDWPQPATVGERIRVGLMLLRIGFAQASRSAIPDWRSLYAGH